MSIRERLPVILHRKGDQQYADPDTLRRRGLRVLCVGPHVLAYLPRRHPLRRL